MVNKFKHTFTLLLIFSGSVLATDNYFGFSYSSFMLRSPNVGRNVNGLFENVKHLQGQYVGGTIAFPCFRNSQFGIGIGLSRIYFQKETQGVFAETNEYGFAIVNGTNDRWTFPISYSWVTVPIYKKSGPRGYKPYHSSFHSGIRISYVPSFEGSVSSNVETFGGAVLSSYASSYTNNTQSFQHSVLFSLSNQISSRQRGFILNIDPYVGIGSGYFKNDRSDISTLSFGISLSIQLRIPDIEIEREITPKPENEERKKLLEQKQKEIEEQLKNKPK